MIFDFQKLKKQDIEKLILEKNMNIASADMLFEVCFASKDYSFSKDNYLSSVRDFLQLNLDDQEDKYFYESRIKPSIKKIDKEVYQENYFRKNITPLPYKGNGYELGYLTIKPYQCLPYDDIEIKDDFVEVSRIGYFDKPFEYLVVNKGDVTWMSTDPNEINTMQKDIDDACGEVLTFGLGLGYFPIMCAIKDGVKSVTVVEKDQEIINIFNKHILPLFPYKEKIHIVHDDAFKFVKKDLNKYDYLFIDIWHNPEDGLPMYLKFKELLKDKNIEVRYWLEKSLLAMLRRCLLSVFEEQLDGSMDKDYMNDKDEYDHIINNLYFKTRNMKFSSIDEVKEILQDKGLLNLI